jgi:hypothetical protein
MLQSLLPLKMVNISCMHISKPIACWITQEAIQNIVDVPLTPISRMGQGARRICFWLYRWPLPHFGMFASNHGMHYQDPTPNIVDTPLTLIFKMGPGVCWYNFCLQRQPIPHLCPAETNLHLDHTRCTAKNRWRSIDVHFHNEVVSISFIVLPRKAASAKVMDSSDQVTGQLPYIQYQNSLMNPWRSFSGWGREHDGIIFDLEGSEYLVYEL